MEVSKRVDNEIREVVRSQMWGLISHCKTLAFTLKKMERTILF